MKKEKIRLSAVSSFHYFRLVFRSALFLIGINCYILTWLKLGGERLYGLVMSRGFLTAVWLIFAFEMVTRFFPSRLESPGCQKQFAKNYRKTGSLDAQFADNNATVLIALLWVTLNGIIGAFKLSGWLDDNIMLLICLFYSVCDMICILFFCPFQSWFLKNKCCSACRIYNWDYAMMFTPLFFVKGWYSWSLLLMSVILLFRWEITIFHYPERFSEKTNAYLACANCSEKLCTHKKQLHSLWKEIAAYTRKRIERLRK